MKLTMRIPRLPAAVPLSDRSGEPTPCLPPVTALPSLQLTICQYPKPCRPSRQAPTPQSPPQPRALRRVDNCGCLTFARARVFAYVQLQLQLQLPK